MVVQSNIGTAFYLTRFLDVYSNASELCVFLALRAHDEVVSYINARYHLNTE